MLYKYIFKESSATSSCLVCDGLGASSVTVFKKLAVEAIFNTDALNYRLFVHLNHPVKSCIILRSFTS